MMIDADENEDDEMMRMMTGQINQNNGGDDQK